MNDLFKSLISSKFGNSLFAGIWFAVAAIIPVAYYLLRFGEGLPILGVSQLLTATVSILLSGFIGLLLGSNILDPKETKSEFKAIGFGLAVALLSFLFLFIFLAILSIFTSGDILGTIVAFAVFFFYGMLIVGWVAASVGAIAGLLLYLLRLRYFE